MASSPIPDAATPAAIAEVKLTDRGTHAANAMAGFSRRAKLSAITCMLGCTIWAFWPMGAVPSKESPSGDAPTSTPREIRLALDTTPFSAPLWMAPPPPPLPPTPPPKAEPLPPLKLQLLAIMGAGEELKAILYDPDADKVLIRKAGESAAGATIKQVTAHEIELVDRAGSRTLALKPGGKP